MEANSSELILSIEYIAVNLLHDNLFTLKNFANSSKQIFFCIFE